MERYKRYILVLPSVLLIVLVVLLNLVFGSLLPKDTHKLALPKKLSKNKEKSKWFVTPDGDTVQVIPQVSDTVDIYQMEPEPPFKEDTLSSN